MLKTESEREEKKRKNEPEEREERNIASASLAWVFELQHTKQRATNQVIWDWVQIRELPKEFLGKHESSSHQSETPVGKYSRILAFVCHLVIVSAIISRILALFLASTRGGFRMFGGCKVLSGLIYHCGIQKCSFAAFFQRWGHQWRRKNVKQSSSQSLTQMELKLWS